jgi:hypothetical protein
MRHERLHTRSSGRHSTSASIQSQHEPQPITPESLNSIDEAHDLSADRGTHANNGAHNEEQRHEEVPVPTPDLISDLNFELIWPDSEDLFQTIMATEFPNVQVGAYSFESPSTPIALDPSLASLPNPNSRVESISVQTIPTGGNQRAVDDVSRMISTMVSRE